jgi:hypothetical protein
MTTKLNYPAVLHNIAEFGFSLGRCTLDITVDGLSPLVFVLSDHGFSKWVVSFWATNSV